MECPELSEMSGKRRVLIVDDHPLFRDGLKSLIDRSSDYVVAGEAFTGAEAVARACELKPQLVTMDISLPDMSGIEATREVCARVPGVKVLILSMHPRFEYVAEAFRAGARGYVVKDTTSAKLVEAMDALDRGEFYLDGKVSQEVVLKLLMPGEREATILDEGYGLLTPREQQILRLVAEGVATRQIAARLSLSPKTVENHRANLMRKLGLHSRAEVVRYAARLGLIDVGGWKE